MENKDLERLKLVIQEEEVIAIIKDLVAIPTYPGIVNQETKAAQYIDQVFKREGIESEVRHVADGRCNVIGRIKGGGKGKSLLLTGHLDTVPPYDMPGDPLELKEQDGKLIGRGTVDMKGAIACMMAAMIGIKRANIELQGDLIFAGVIDEEEKSLGTIDLIERKLQADAAIVGEPSALHVCIAHRGLEWFEISFKGKTVHGGKQKDGVNAILQASTFIQRCEEKLLPIIEAEKHPLIGSSSMNYGTIKGGTQPSTVAGDCTLKIDRRWVPGIKYEETLKAYEDMIDQLKREDPSFDCTLKVMDESVMKVGYVHEAMEIDENHPIVRIAREATKDLYKKEADITYFTAWSDGGLLSSYGKIPTIIFGPGDLETAHSAVEFIPKGEVWPATLIYAAIGMRFCG